MSFTPEQVELLRRTVAKGTTDDELLLFVNVANRLGLDPFARQIHCVVRENRRGRSMTIQVGIDGFRLVALRSGEYRGQRPIEWCDDTGAWTQVWLEPTIAPVAARATVLREGWAEPVVAVAHWAEYVQMTWDDRTRGHVPNAMWSKMACSQLAKCAESLALRRAFPAELSGVYTPDEMAQADNLPSEEVKPSPVGREADGSGTATQATPAAGADVRLEEARRTPLPQEVAQRLRIPEGTTLAEISLDAVPDVATALLSSAMKPRHRERWLEAVELHQQDLEARAILPASTNGGAVFDEADYEPIAADSSGDSTGEEVE